MISQLARKNLAYAVGSVANGGALFLLIPYLTRALTPAEFGAWTLFEIMLSLLVTLTMAGMDVGLMRHYWFIEEEERRRRLSGSVLIAVLLWGLVVAAVAGTLLVWAGRRSGAFGLGLVELAPVVAMLLLIGLVEALFAMLLSLFRIREEARTFVMLSVGRMGLFLLLAIVGVELSGSLLGALGGRLGASLLAGAAALVAGARLFVPRLDRALLADVLRYGVPLIPALLASYVLFASDRYILDFYATLEQVAIYGLAYKLATALDIVVTRPFSIDWAPRRFRIAASEEPEPAYIAALQFYLVAALGVMLLLWAAMPLIYRLVAAPAYGTGMGLVPLIMLAYLLYGLSYPLNIGAMLRDRTGSISALSWGAALLCVLLNLWWISLYGMVGAAWATVVSYGVLTAGIAWLSQHLYPVRYPLAPLGLIAVAGLVGYGGIELLARLLSAGTLLGATVRVGWVVLLWSVVVLALFGKERGRWRRSVLARWQAGR